MMSSFTVSMIVELLVAGLLAATIAYCVRLNRRLTLLKSDEQSLKATIAELVTATEIAERAIQGLKITVRECDGTLGERLRTAERFLADIDREVGAGRVVMDRIAKIVSAASMVASKPEPVAEKPALSRMASAADAAAAIRARAARRLEGQAA
jgi:hypothetical protein